MAFGITLTSLLVLLAASRTFPDWLGFLTFLGLCLSVPVGTLVALILTASPKHIGKPATAAFYAFPMLGLLAYPIAKSVPYISLLVNLSRYQRVIDATPPINGRRVVVLDWKGGMVGSGITVLLYDEDGGKVLSGKPRPPVSALHYTDGLSDETACIGHANHLIGNYYSCHLD